MNAKNLLTAMALPLAFAACSSEDVLTESQVVKGQYDVQQVDVAFGMDGVESRLANGWFGNLETEDLIGLAWLYDGAGKIQLTGAAYQNHPLYPQADGSLEPETSIYVGEYYTYYPYNDNVKSIQNVDFSVEKQPLTTVYNETAKKSIWISPKWSTVTIEGDGVDGAAGIGNATQIYPRQFTNKVRLELAYINNKIDQGNTSIEDIAISYINNQDDPISVKSFVYAPIAEEFIETQTVKAPAQEFWQTRTFAPRVTASTPTAAGGTMTAPVMLGGADASEGAIILDGADHEVLPTEDLVESFRYNALPAAEAVTADTKVKLVMTTTYGIITIEKPVNQIAYTHPVTADYYEFADGARDNTTNDLLGVVDYDQSFIQTLYKSGKLATEVDFLTAVMDGMCVKDDAHLQKLLSYYAQYKKNNSKYNEVKPGRTAVILNLDPTNGQFELSKTSIAMLRELNAGATQKYVSIQPCVKSGHGAPAIIITGGGEIPEMNLVFEKAIEKVTLKSDEWTWNETAKKNFGYVQSISNAGTITVGSENVEAQFWGRNVDGTLINNSIINFEAVAKVKIDLTNYGTINVAEDAEMRAYAEIVNDVVDVTGVRQGVWGIINNQGVVGIVEDVNKTTGKIYNYGLIEHAEGAITWITANQTSTIDFGSDMSDNNKIGIINIQEPDASVSVVNTTDKGMITYTWEATEDGVYVTPDNVKYNYLIVKDDITFTSEAAEILYLEFQGNRTRFQAAKDVLTGATDPQRLNGVIVPVGNSVQLEKGNYLTTKAALVEGTVYNGGTFAVTGNKFETYFGGEANDIENVVKQ